MTSSTAFKLKEVDPEEIGAILIKIQKTFNFKFNNTDFKDCRIYGDLCDVINGRLDNYKHLNDCTSQQAFYKIRESILSINPKKLEIQIAPNTRLEELFPKSNRRKQIKLFKQELKLRVAILSMQAWLSSIFVVCITASLILFFFNWRFTVAGVLSFTILHLIASQFNKEFNFKTVGDLAKKIASTNYFHFRRNKNTINKKEIQKIIDDLFIHDLGIDKTELYKGASLGWD